MIESSPNIYGISDVSSVFQDTEVQDESGKMWDPFPQAQEPPSAMSKPPEPTKGGGVDS